MTLAEYQFDLSGFVFGHRSDPVVVSRFDSGGKPDVRDHDTPVPAGDGIRFGRDFLNGAVYTWEGFVDGGDAGQGLEHWSEMRRVWDAHAVRTEPGATTMLRMRMPARDVRRVYGRPRKIAPATIEHVGSGVVPFVADFQAVDHLLYADAPVSVSVGKAPDVRSGLGGPWADPLGDNSGTVETRSGVFHVGGDVATTHIEVEFRGPVSNPACEIVGVGTVTLVADLADGQSARIRVLTAFRSVTVNGRPAAGSLRGTSLREFHLPTGWQEVRFHGLDSTGTAEMTLTAYPAYASL